MRLWCNVVVYFFWVLLPGNCKRRAGLPRNVALVLCTIRNGFSLSVQVLYSFVFDTHAYHGRIPTFASSSNATLSVNTLCLRCTSPQGFAAWTIFRLRQCRQVLGTRIRTFSCVIRVPRTDFTNSQSAINVPKGSGARQYDTDTGR